MDHVASLRCWVVRRRRRERRKMEETKNESELILARCRPALFYFILFWQLDVGLTPCTITIPRTHTLCISFPFRRPLQQSVIFLLETFSVVHSLVVADLCRWLDTLNILHPGPSLRIRLSHRVHQSSTFTLVSWPVRPSWLVPHLTLPYSSRDRTIMT